VGPRLKEEKLPEAPRARHRARESQGHARLHGRDVTLEEYQFARLCHYLRGKEPLAQPGYTFLIYRLTDDEVMNALYGPVSLKMSPAAKEDLGRRGGRRPPRAPLRDGRRQQAAREHDLGRDRARDRAATATGRSTTTGCSPRTATCPSAGRRSPWLRGAKFPTLDQAYWRKSDAWVMGHEFFYETGEDHFPRLMEARAMIALLSVATGALVFCWSLRLFGTPGAFVSLAFFAFSPSFLAHGGYATSDVCMALFMLASVGAYWRHLGRPGAGPFLSERLGLRPRLRGQVLRGLPAPHDGALRRGPPRHDPGRARAGRPLGRGPRRGRLRGHLGLLRVPLQRVQPGAPGADQFIEAWPIMYARTGWDRPGHPLPGRDPRPARGVPLRGRLRRADLPGAGRLPERGVQHRRLAELLHLDLPPQVHASLPPRLRAVRLGRGPRPALRPAGQPAGAWRASSR
jgi:hypothetical protein